MRAHCTRVSVILFEFVFEFLSRGASANPRDVRFIYPVECGVWCPLSGARLRTRLYVTPYNTELTPIRDRHVSVSGCEYTRVSSPRTASTVYLRPCVYYTHTTHRMRHVFVYTTKRRGRHIMPETSPQRQGTCGSLRGHHTDVRVWIRDKIRTTSTRHMHISRTCRTI